MIIFLVGPWRVVLAPRPDDSCGDVGQLLGHGSLPALPARSEARRWTVTRPDELDAQSVGPRDSTVSESDSGDDGVTADSLSVEGLFRSFHLLAGPSS